MDLIQRAQERQAEIEERRQLVRAELELLDQEAERWHEFVKDAMALAKGEKSKRQARRGVAKALKRNETTDQPSLTDGSYSAVAAVLIRDKGPQTLDELLAAMVGMRGNKTDKAFRTSVYSGLWRRLDDVFTQTEDGRFDLKNRNFVIVAAKSGRLKKNATKH